MAFLPYQLVQDFFHQPFHLSVQQNSLFEAMAGLFLHLSAAGGSQVGLMAQQAKTLPSIEECVTVTAAWGNPGKSV